jgi:hypothetical protein
MPPSPVSAPPPARPQAAWTVALLALALGAGCARPYRTQKTLATIGIGLLAGSAAVWVAGERTNHNTITNIGMAGAAAGSLAAISAGVWLAGSAGCNVDPDCPDDEACREIPAPPGREPFRQCTPK